MTSKRDRFIALVESLETPAELAAAIVEGYDALSGMIAPPIGLSLPMARAGSVPMGDWRNIMKQEPTDGGMYTGGGGGNPPFQSGIVSGVTSRDIAEETRNAPHGFKGFRKYKPTSQKWVKDLEKSADLHIPNRREVPPGAEEWTGINTPAMGNYGMGMTDMPTSWT